MMIFILTIKLSIEDENIIKEKLILNRIGLYYNNKILRILDGTYNKESNNTNYTFPQIKSRGLSTGGIIAILIPCILALIAAVALVLYCTCCKAPFYPNPVIDSTTAIPSIESTMDQFQSQQQVKPPIPIQSSIQLNPQPVIPPKEVIVQPPPKVIEIVHPQIQVYKEAPSTPKINRVFDPLFPVPEKVVPIQQIVEIKQITPQISQVQQVVSIPKTSVIQKIVSIPTITQVEINNAPNISEVQQVVPSSQISQVQISQPSIQIETEPKITESYVSVSESKVLPDINTSQVSASKIMPTKILPKIRTESQVLPLKVLPPIDASTKQISGFENNPQYQQFQQIPINNNKTLLSVSNTSEEIPTFSNNSSINVANSLNFYH